MNNYLNTKKWDLWVAAGGILIGRDIDLRVKIPLDIGTGVQMERDDKIWTSTREFGGRDKNYLKTIKLKISSWRVLSIDAVHFYGVLTSPGVEFEISKDDNQRVSSSGLNSLLYLQNINIELTKTVTQEMIDADPGMWQFYYANSVTTRFNTIEEVIERGKYIFNKWFDKRWGLSLEKSWSNKTKILIK